MSRRPFRLAFCFAVLLLGLLSIALTIRSIWISDTVQWRTSTTTEFADETGTYPAISDHDFEFACLNGVLRCSYVYTPLAFKPQHHLSWSSRGSPSLFWRTHSVVEVTTSTADGPRPVYTLAVPLWPAVLPMLVMVWLAVRRRRGRDPDRSARFAFVSLLLCLLLIADATLRTGGMFLTIGANGAYLDEPTWAFAGISYLQTPESWQMHLPYWPFIALTAILPLRQFRRGRRAAYRLKHDLCTECGYDLRASTGRCPECGTPVVAPPPANRRLVTMVTLLLCLPAILTPILWLRSATHRGELRFALLEHPYAILLVPGRIIFLHHAGDDPVWNRGWHLREGTLDANWPQAFRLGLRPPTGGGHLSAFSFSIPLGWLLPCTLLLPITHLLLRRRRNRRAIGPALAVSAEQ